jgi:protoporphyrinogen oxidase
MPLFNNAAIAASFKATSTLATHNTTNGNDTKRNRTGTETKKCELVKQEAPTGVTVLRLVLPTTEDSYYTDMPDATTAQALEAIMEILEQQEENLKLVGKQEWGQPMTIHKYH